MVIVVKKHIIFSRVSYGNSNTTIKKREYVGNFWGSPVGTKEEIMKWAKANNKTIEFKESPRTRVFIEEKE